MNQKKKAELVGILWALLVHIAVVAFLWLMHFDLPKPQEEGGVPVMLGEVPDASGLNNSSLVEVDVLTDATQTTPEPESAEHQPQQVSQPDVVITQKAEETVAMPEHKNKVKKKEKPMQEVKPAKKPVVSKKDVKPKKHEPTEAEKKAEAERRAKAEVERRQKEAAEAASKRVAGAFGKGAKMGSGSGTSQGKGAQGSTDGNSATGLNKGVGGYGTYNLGGRSIGMGGLPRPVYNVQDEGRVVVDITVNPAGVVINARINRQTNTVNSSLQKAAIDAAKKARFNTISGLNNQSGTITYYFKLK